jgi:lysozyme
MRKSSLFTALLFTFLIQLAGCAHLNDQEYEQVDDALPPGSLVEELRALIPEGTVLREVYPAGIALTKDSEGWRNKLYNDAARYCTIGYGHLIKKKPCNGTEPAEFKLGITKPRGEEILVSDMKWAKYSVQKAVKVNLTEGQYAALVDFVFNVGSGNFQSSSLLKIVNTNNHGKVPSQLKRWVKARGKTFPGLVTRRNREVALYLEGTRLLPALEENLQPIDIQEGERLTP